MFLCAFVLIISKFILLFFHLFICFFLSFILSLFIVPFVHLSFFYYPSPYSFMISNTLPIPLHHQTMVLAWYTIHSIPFNTSVSASLIYISNTTTFFSFRCILMCISSIRKKIKCACFLSDLHQTLQCPA